MFDFKIMFGFKIMFNIKMIVDFKDDYFEENNKTLLNYWVLFLIALIRNHLDF